MDEIEKVEREKRSAVIVRAEVSAPGFATTERRVRNLSPSGACIDHAAEFTTGMTVLLQMGTITHMTATVMWVTDTLAGLQFDEPIDMDEARKPRGITSVPKAGWMADIKHAYRR